MRFAKTVWKIVDGDLVKLHEEAFASSLVTQSASTQPNLFNEPTATHVIGRLQRCIDRIGERFGIKPRSQRRNNSATANESQIRRQIVVDGIFRPTADVLHCERGAAAWNVLPDPK
jgi:hypothetical protein